MDNPKTLLEVKNLTLKKDGKTLLNSLNLEVWEGYVHAVVGPNGAGKSTFANTIMGLSGYRQIEGDIIFDGVSIKDLSIEKRAKLGITLAFQEPARFEGITVEDFLLASSKYSNSKKEEKRAEIPNASVENFDHIIEKGLLKVGLDPIKYRKRAVDKNLSGGERKRIELASIYVMKPELVIMDEPDSGIDIDSLNYIYEIISDFKKEGSTVILVTHSQQVLRWADHAFLLCGGKLVDKGKMSDMLKYFSNKCKPCDHIGTPDTDIN